MKIAAKKVVELAYVLKNDAGEVLDQSEKGEPLRYIHGEGQIVPGLEKALEGKKKGDKVDVAVSPAEGYGVRDEHYETVAVALLWALEIGLHEGFTVEVRDAWATVYWLLADAMKAGAADCTLARSA